MSRGLLLAFKFLTRLPVPSASRFDGAVFAQCAYWFPVVGAVVGACVSLATVAGAQRDPWLGALLGVITWVWITGGLHLDGLADYADARGAMHRNPQRFLEVLHDPHVGSFGVLALVLAVLTKLITLRMLATDASAWFVALIAAWSRWGALAWSVTLPPLTSGMASGFAWDIRRAPTLIIGAALFAFTCALAPQLLVAPVAILLWLLYLRHAIGGVTGDCLGAGVEIVELALLLWLCALPVSR